MDMGWIEANGATLYYERRGSGPTVLFISGATGDAGHWTEVGNILAEESTVVIYDRRANSRSPRPAGWDCTTIDEQADDAAALLTGLQLAPAVVFGTSAGAGILANLCLRHPELLSGAVFHEPLFPSGVSHPEVVRAGRRALIERGMAMGGSRAATELFLRSVAGDETYERMDADLRERLLGNGDVLFDIEMATYLSYEPTREEIEAIEIPCAVTAGADNRDESVPGHWRYEAAQWLAAHLDVPVVELPGGHMAYLGQPHAFAQDLQQLLHSLGN